MKRNLGYSPLAAAVQKVFNKIDFHHQHPPRDWHKIWVNTNRAILVLVDNQERMLMRTFTEFCQSKTCPHESDGCAKHCSAKAFLLWKQTEERKRKLEVCPA